MCNLAALALCAADVEVVDSASLLVPVGSGASVCMGIVNDEGLFVGACIVASGVLDDDEDDEEDDLVDGERLRVLVTVRVLRARTQALFVSNFQGSRVSLRCLFEVHCIHQFHECRCIPVFRSNVALFSGPATFVDLDVSSVNVVLYP